MDPEIMSFQTLPFPTNTGIVVLYRISVYPLMCRIFYDKKGIFINADFVSPPDSGMEIREYNPKTDNNES